MSVFVARAFKRRKVQPATLEKIAVWDWKAWLDDHMRHLEGHSFQRSFLLKIEDQKPVVYYKNNVLAPVWYGAKDRDRQRG